MSRSAPTFWDGIPVTEICAVLRPDGSDHRLQEIKGLPNWRIERFDVADQGLRDLLARHKPKAVLHLAFDAAGFLVQSEDAWRRTHLNPLSTMFHALSGSAAGRIVHTSSAWVLAEGDRLSETARLEPRLEYAKTKARLDEALPGLGQQTGVNWINLRLFNVFGRYESETRLLPHLVSCLRKGVPAQLSHGDQVRDFNDVDDVADAYLHALIAPDAVCNAVYHVGSGIGTSVREFATKVAKEIGDENLIQYDAAVTRDQDIPCLVADPTRIEAALGWRPGADLQQRISGAVQWWMHRMPATSRPMSA
jgi:dolichol-phosphate mannosyltransferase